MSLPSGVVAQEQRPDAMSAALGITPSDHHKLYPVEAFDLQHVRRSGSYRPFVRFETMPSTPCSQANRWKAGLARSGDRYIAAIPAHYSAHMPVGSCALPVAGQLGKLCKSHLQLIVV